MKRLAIYPKDIMVITGKGERHSRDILKQIKQKLKKEKHQVVTMLEFCDYIGISYDEIQNILK